jgi:hypothetical protein
MPTPRPTLPARAALMGSTLAAIVACAEKVDPDSAAAEDPWEEVAYSPKLAPAAGSLQAVRGLVPRRAIVHLHSPWSHDACDGEPMPDGAPDADCLADLRAGLCDVAVDYAFLTDHPAHAAEQAYGDLFHSQPGDEALMRGGAQIASQIPCGDRQPGHAVVWLPGIEDALMPVALDRHVGGSSAENDAIYNQIDGSAVEANIAAGATVLVAHTEQRSVEALAPLLSHGLRGVELFNLHAAFDPDLRADYLGLDPMGWLADVAPFTAADGTGEPDFLFLAVLREQKVSLDVWDGLNLLAPVVGTAGTDAHQNVLPLLLRDGERGDSYRRMLRWFTNTLLLPEGVGGPEAAEQALQSGRLYVAFEVLGTPQTVDVSLLGEDGVTYEIGDSAPVGGTLQVACPNLAPGSPRGAERPAITVTVFKDGLPFSEGCGEVAVSAPGVYRVRVDIVPYHLRAWLGADPEPWLVPYPWIYTNPIRVGLATPTESP